MEIIDEHEEDEKNERQNKNENRVIIGTIKKKIERKTKLGNEN